MSYVHMNILVSHKSPRKSYEPHTIFFLEIRLLLQAPFLLRIFLSKYQSAQLSALFNKKIFLKSVCFVAAVSGCVRACVFFTLLALSFTPSQAAHYFPNCQCFVVFVVSYCCYCCCFSLFDYYFRFQLLYVNELANRTIP